MFEDIKKKEELNKIYKALTKLEDRILKLEKKILVSQKTKENDKKDISQ